jgi:hypothetical protein
MKKGKCPNCKMPVEYKETREGNITTREMYDFIWDGEWSRLVPHKCVKQ